MGRGCTMDEWVHFEKLPEEGRVPNSSYWYVHCRHCVRGFEQKQLFNAPAKLTGRRSAMRAHLKICPMYATQYKMEQRALAAAAVAAAATSAAAQSVGLDGGSLGVGGVVVGSNSDGAASVTGAGEAGAVGADAALAAAVSAGVVTIKTLSGEKRKRRGEDVEVSGPRGGRGKHCMMEEWEHFTRLQDEGYIGKSNFFYAVCRHCQNAYDEAPEDKKPELVPEKMVGRREKMRKHLSVCPFFKGELPSLERRTHVRTSGPGAFLPLPTPDGIKMVPASALASALAADLAGLHPAGGASASTAESSNGGNAADTTPSTRLALDEWQYFTRLHRKKDSAYYFARCNFCQQAFDNAPEALKTSMNPTIVMGRKSNMQTHLAKCPYVPKDTVLFNKAVVPGFGGGMARDEITLAALKRFKGMQSIDASTLFHGIVEFTIQHRLPFEWVDSSSGAKLLRLGLIAIPDVGVLPTSEDVRGQILSDLYQTTLSGELEKIKQRVTLPAAEETTSSEPLPIVMKVTMSPSAEADAVPVLDCTLTAEGASVPIQFVVEQKNESDEDLVTGINAASGISYFHGLEVARWIDTQLRRVIDDNQIATGIVMLPPSRITSRAVGILHARWPNIVFAWNLEDLVAFCLRKALENAQISQIVAATAELWEVESIRQLGGATVPPTDDWLSFVAFAQELLNEHPAEIQAIIENKVDRNDLTRVTGLLRAFATVNGSIASGKATMADALTHFASLFAASEGFEDIRTALEVVWAECEQPLYLLANALHPHLRLRGVATTALTKFSVLSDLSVTYFTQFFSRKPASLRGDVTSFVHSSQPVFSDPFISEFPVVNDYFRYLRDNYAELAALMQLLSSFSAIGPNAVDPSKSRSPFDERHFTAEERQKLAMLEKQWGLETPSYREDTKMGDASELAGSSVVGKWLERLNQDLLSRQVEFHSLDTAFTAAGCDDTEDEALHAAAQDADENASADMPLPSQIEDDAEGYPSTPLRGDRSKKVRLEELFASSDTTTV